MDHTYPAGLGDRRTRPEQARVRASLRSVLLGFATAPVQVTEWRPRLWHRVVVAWSRSEIGRLQSDRRVTDQNIIELEAELSRQKAHRDAIDRCIGVYNRDISRSALAAKGLR